MTSFEKYGRTWYTTRREAESVRNKGERIYFDASMKAYYIIPKSKSFCGIEEEKEKKSWKRLWNILAVTSIMCAILSLITYEQGFENSLTILFMVLATICVIVSNAVSNKIRATA